MKIEGIQVLSGPNYWSLRPCIQMRLDIGLLEEKPTNKLDQFYERLVNTLPSLYEHRCSIGTAGGFFERIKDGTWMGHVVEHVALELQTLAEMDTGFGRTRETKTPGVYNVVFSYIVSEAGRRAAKLSVQFCEDLINGNDPKLDEIILELKELREEYKLGPSTSSIVDEAVRREIPYFRLNRGSLVQLGYGKNQKRIRATMTSQTGSLAVDFAQDKWETKTLLEDQGIPVPKGLETSRLERAKNAVEKFGYPLVVKPSDGNHGRGITVGVNNNEHFEISYEAAMKQSKNGYVIIEQMLEGSDFRFLVINGTLVAAAKRIPAHVKGDGEHSIQELIDKENENPLRGYGHENVLTEIDIDSQTERLISDANYTLDSILNDHEILYLKTTANLSTGGTAIDILDSVHPANIHIAERAIKIIGLDIGGVNIVAPNVTTPLTENGGGIVEVNAAPGFRMHLQPTEGLARNVAEPVIDMLFPPGKSCTIPIIAITGTNGKTTTTRLTNHIYKLAGNTVGMCTTEGVYIKNRMIYQGDMTGPMSHKMVLTDPTVDLAILECARGGMLRSGLGFKSCNVGIVTNVSEDHLGLRGIHTIEQLARVKSIIPEIVKQDGVAVLNADDSLVSAMSEKTKGSVIYFSMDWKNNSVVTNHLKEGGIATVYDDGWLCMMKGQWKYPIVDVKDVPLTFGGKAKFNIMNALASAGACIGLGLKLENIKAGLSTFFPSHTQTPGRLTMTDMGDYNVIVDYAHNKAGYDALIDFVSSYSPEKTIMSLCVPGDRRDEDFEGIAESCAKSIDTIVIFESYLRGLKEGELSNKLKFYLTKHGMNENQIVIIYDEQSAVQHCLNVGEDYDFVILSNYDIDDTHIKVLAHREKLEQEKSTK
ncbi:MAG: cyanophycin synthetase [Candidatus Marinimicrobia bacterium]|nr:cyanophycin synthetase [Candidatus Neomarinimicrobiota bacterium]MBT5996061.1 cyanophycin synthetase [Candidatus Neomarinimicrobiota bacterium]